MYLFLGKSPQYLMISLVFYSNLDTASLLAVWRLAALHLITTLLHTAGSQPRLGLAKARLAIKVQGVVIAW